MRPSASWVFFTEVGVTKDRQELFPKKGGLKSPHNQMPHTVLGYFGTKGVAMSSERRLGLALRKQARKYLGTNEHRVVNSPDGSRKMDGVQSRRPRKILMLGGLDQGYLEILL